MFFYNDSKPGKGVEKRDPNKSRILVFFDILPGKLWKLCKLNVLYLFSIIPTYIITMVVMGCISAPIINALSGLFEDSSFFSSNIWFDLIIRGILAFLFTVFGGKVLLQQDLPILPVNIARNNTVGFLVIFLKN